MKIKFTKETTLDLFKKLNFLEDLSELFTQYSFGKGIDAVYVCLHSLDPEFGIWRDFETGLVVHKKYTKSQKTLEFSYKLNHKQVTDAHTIGEVLTIILEGFKKTYNEIKSLNIKDFDVDEFYRVVASVIEDFAQKDYVPKERLFLAPAKEKKVHPKEAKMNEVIFWEIIEQSKDEREDYANQIQILKEKLSKLDEQQIIGFEYTLRSIIAESAHYNIVAATKIINDFASDDNFLYLRCRLIAEGKDVYYNSIKNPETLANPQIQEIEFGGEEMLSVADQAFIMKFGEDTEKELPRDIAFDYINYDEEEDIKGEDWKEEDLPFKYPELWKRYKK